MKIDGARVEEFVRRPKPSARAVLVYGRDEGLVRERADQLVGHVTSDICDPFRVVEIAPSRLDDDPSRLADEAASLCLAGGRRVVRVRPASEIQADVFERFLASPTGDALVVVEAGDLGPRSRLRRAFETSPSGAALPCYPDEGVGLRRLIKDTLAHENFSAEPAALEVLAMALGGDRLATRADLDKLMIYLGNSRKITVADVTASVGDSSRLTLEGIAIAVADGDMATTERLLTRAYQEDISPIALLRAAMRHLERLHRVLGSVELGESPRRAVKSLRPSVYFRVSDALERQSMRWTTGRVVQAMAIATEAERACKSTGRPAEIISSRAIMRVAHLAARSATNASFPFPS